MNDPEDASTRRRGNWMSGIAIGLACLLLAVVLYVLSIGPVVLLHEVVDTKRMRWSADAIEAAYAPLVWWHDRDLPGAQLLDAYVEWWD